MSCTPTTFLPTLPTCHGFVAGIREILAPDGVAALEFPYVGDMIDRCEFDTIYHEHLCYFSLSALVHLFDRSGLKAVDCRARADPWRFAAPAGGARRAPALTSAPSVTALLDEEGARGMRTVEFYRGFARRVETLKGDLRALLARLKSEGRSIAAYGAAAKGSTLLNTFGIGRETLDFVADRSTHKQGRFMPGVRLPIVPPDPLWPRRCPTTRCCSPGTSPTRSCRQQAEYRRRGGKFIVPVPEVKVI